MEFSSGVSPNLVSPFNVHDWLRYDLIKRIFRKCLQYTFLQGVLGNIDFAKGVDNPTYDDTYQCVLNGLVDNGRFVHFLIF
jgi:hypothetical protein